MSQMLEIYTESTPNPNSLKFVLNRTLLPNETAEFKKVESFDDCNLAVRLFETHDTVDRVFVSNNFVTLTKVDSVDWFELTIEVKESLKAFFSEGTPVFQPSFYEKLRAKHEAEASKGPDAKIQELLDKYVKPAIEMDGGNIAFHSFEEGTVKLIMQGACSGCPSSSVTLKSGIENLLKRMVPGVEEVVAVEE